ncbi:hypothetical protein GCM10011344_07070 [Dokdonia pacifica]|uniref:Uncharacterized protein n=1 Tax=Dokdonia pacifica TaxID=1627892 RepID=A0A238Z123_9FLAO|nr:hypothetical protein [Dokdonia pacifica]GGG09051.1 hypothetical protein GCM10011344_07070 [Dokdonia pacifica]SNR76638.1 hypothetical protein SAMN06265376_102495 [Dokdonia pacifica]
MENKKEIFAPRFDGSRFENHTMPLELLEDLKVLQEMTVEMAKALYLEQNTDRQRVPKNFTQGISFELEGLQEGSTIPKIIMTFALAGMFPEANVTYFEQASEHIKEVVQIASEDGNISENAPSSVLAYFNRFGKKLREDEHIEFRPEHSDKKARFTRNTRRKLISASSTSGEYTEDTMLRGTLCEMDKSKLSFQIETPSGKKITGFYDELQYSQFLQAFGASQGNQKVIVNGLGKFSSFSKLKEIKSVEELILLDENDLGYRLDELSQLKDGWLNGEGTKLSKEALKWFELKFETFIEALEVNTYAYPTPDGNLQLEWSNEDLDIELVVNLETKTSDLQIINHTNPSNETNIILELSEDDSWSELNTLLKEHLS